MCFAHFVNAVLKVAPDGVGEAVGIVRGGETIVRAFMEAAFWRLPPSGCCVADIAALFGRGADAVPAHPGRLRHA